MGRVVAVERDLVHFPATYYFSESDERFALPVCLPFVLELAERTEREARDDEVILAAAMLQRALADFAATTAAHFHGRAGDSPFEALAAYTADHGQRAGTTV